MMLLLVLGTIGLVLNVQPVQASGTVYIRADGSIDPPTASIQTNGDIYTLTSDILQSSDMSDCIVIERDNIVFDGSGFTIQGNLNGQYLLIGNGIYLSGRSNVTIQNVNITDFNNGIFLNSSLNIRIRGNNMAENWYCIYLDSSSKISITENNITNEWCIYFSSSSNNIINGNNIGIGPQTYNGHYGISLVSSSSNNSISENNIASNDVGGIFLNSSSDYNSISENNIASNGDFGIRLLYSSEYNGIDGNNITNNQMEGITFDSSSVNNIISGNTIENNTVGLGKNYSSEYNSTSITDIALENSSATALYSTNTVFHNNFINNTDQANASAIWDNGYPSGGNYWSDYAGVDLYSGPYKNITGNDGIGDTPYIIGANNTDHYPLMNSWYHILGDINFDGKVSLVDLVYLANAYGTTPTSDGITGTPHAWNPNADINGDGIVDLADLVILAQHYGQHASAQPSEAGFRMYSLQNTTILISDADILSYNWTSQEMAITPEASERLTEMGDLYSWTGFVIKIDGEEIYRGIFREYTMSAIPTPPKISVLFPSASFPFESVNYGAIRMFFPSFQPPSDQPVNNAKILQYFEKTNKLKY
jgi:parallel beta-helix repeat protein